MEQKAVDVTVAGHICLDIIPSFHSSSTGFTNLLVPGKLVDIGPAVTSTGGAVSNTGIALHRLGFSTQLMGKVGDDLFGRGIRAILREQGEGLDAQMIVSRRERSSYTVVINPPNVDRLFLHCTGANDTYTASDLKLEEVAASRLFHFGYPPLMRRMYEDGGKELALMLASVKRLGLTVTLDMAMPDPASQAGRADWKQILQKVLPHVDVFFPSFEEILYMMDRNEYERLRTEHSGEDIIAYATPELLNKLAASLMEWGAAAVVLKLGEHGLFVRTSADEQRWQSAGRCAPKPPASWLGRELFAPVYQVQAVGTTGAGDCTIAGFIAGMLKGLTLEETISSALAVGACCVEQADATSGIPHWEAVKARVAGGWPRREVKLQLEGWDPR